MSSNIINVLRITPRDSEFLDRKLGSRGEIFFDRDSNSLRLFDGQVTGGVELAKANLTNIENTVFFNKAAAAGVGAAGITTFRTISVAGQVDIIAESSTDTLTLTAGNGITITTNVETDTITIANDAIYSLPTASTEVLGGVKVDGSSIVINNGIISATAPTDTFSFSVAADDSTQRVIQSKELIKFIGAGSVTTSSDADGYITITGETASTSLTSLTDVSSAGITVDRIYLPAMTMLVVTSSGVTAWRFDQYGSTNNPTIYVISGTTVAFNIQTSGHPFLLQDNTLTNITTGLTHVTTTGVVTTGANAQGKTSGTLYWKIPQSVGGLNYVYQCDDHVAMYGTITIKDIATL